MVEPIREAADRGERKRYTPSLAAYDRIIWLSEFKALAAARARLVGVRAADYGSPKEPLIDRLGLEFEGEGTLLLQCRSDGQGFELERSEPEAASGTLRDLADEPPFVVAVGSALQTAGVITWPIPWDEPERPPMEFPIGVRLEFPAGEVWILNLGDEVELFGERPPYWDEYELSEHGPDDERWLDAGPEPPGNRW